jgi:hypothetical protein
MSNLRIRSRKREPVLRDRAFKFVSGLEAFGWNAKLNHVAFKRLSGGLLECI